MRGAEWRRSAQTLKFALFLTLSAPQANAFFTPHAPAIWLPFRQSTLLPARAPRPGVVFASALPAEGVVQQLAAATLRAASDANAAGSAAMTGDEVGGEAQETAGEGDILQSSIEAVKEAVTPLSVAEDGRVSLDGQKLLNLAVLLGLGGWLLHTFLTVDAQIWRGWTWQEVAMRLPYDSWNSYETGLEESPVLTKTIINVVIYLVGDWMAQVQWGRDGKDLLDFDLARTLRNGFIALLFGPLVHYYYEWSDVVLPLDVPINRPLKILLDQSIYFATKCSAYIALVALLRGDGPEAAAQQVKSRLWPVLTTGWKFWPLVHVVTYSVVPPRHRVLWVNCVDLLWSSILSSTTNSSKAAEEAAAAEAAAAAAATAGGAADMGSADAAALPEEKVSEAGRAI